MNRQTLAPLNQLTWIALTSVFHLGILLVVQTFPFVGYWFTFILPFFAMVTLMYTNWRGWMIYLFTTAILILLLAQAPFEMLWFYWFPSISLGTVYGFVIKKTWSLFSLVLMLSLMQLIVLSIIRWLSFTLYQLDFLLFLYTLLGLANETNIHTLDPLILSAIALIQVLLSVLMTLPLIERWRLPVAYQIFFSRNQTFFYGILLMLAMVFAFVSPSLSLYLLSPLSLMTVYLHVYFLFRPQRIATYALLFAFLLYPFVNALLSNQFDGPYRILSILFLGLTPFFLALHKSITQNQQNALI